MDEEHAKQQLSNSDLARHERVFSGPTSPTSGSGSDSLGGITDTGSDTGHPTFLLGVGVRKEGVASRTHSMSNDALRRPQVHRPDSDPAPTTINSSTINEESSRAEVK